MKQYSDYDEIKRELEIMKVSMTTWPHVMTEAWQYVEFSGADFEGDDDVRLPDPNADVANKQLGRSLENLLVAKNRRLLEELTKLRVLWEDLSGQHVKSEDAIEGLQNEVARQRNLNEKLENDLIAVNKGANGEMGKERSGTGTPAQGLAGLDIGGKVVRTVCRARLELKARAGRPSVTCDFRCQRGFLHTSHRHEPARSLPTT